MGISIQHNISAMNSQRNMGVANKSLSSAMEKLSTGFRINRAGDDAAGLAISQKMRAQIRGLNQSSRNASDGISLIQTAEGALATTNDILERLDELATQSANGTYTDKTDRDSIQLEVDQLLADIDRISNDTEFNTMKLLNGDLASGGASLTVTANETLVGKSASAILSGGSYATQAASDFKLEIGTNSITVLGSELDLRSLTFTSGANAASNEATLDPLLKALEATINEKIASGIKGGEIEGNLSVSLSFVDGKLNLNLTAEDGFSDKITISGGIATRLGVDKSVSLNAKSDAVANGLIGTKAVSSLGTFSMLAQTQFVMEIGDEKITVSGFTTSILASGTGLASALNAAASFMAELNSGIAGALSNAGLTNYNITAVLDADGKLNIKAVTDGLTEDVTIKISGSIADGFGASGDIKLSASGVSDDGKMVLHVGANEGQVMKFDINDMGTKALGVKGLKLNSQESAEVAITTIQDAINKVSMERAKLGAVQNRLDYAITNLDTTSENLSASEAQIRDTDMAAEVLKQTQFNVLQQAAQSMLAQANQQPQMVLQLLG